MPARDPALPEMMDFARQLAEESGDLIRRYFRTGYEVEQKADASPVTIADRGAEELMRQRIQATYPSHGILGEEYGVHQPDAEYCWVLDPIDGTKNFISSSYLFGTLIALLKNGRPLLGVIHQPVVRDLLIGNGEGAWLNGQAVRVSPCARVEDAILLTSDHWCTFDYQNGAAFETLSKRVLRYRTWGDCHGYHLVATGGAHVMTDPIMNEWDYMALIPIVEGAGGRITNWQGDDPLAGSGIVATCGSIHDEVIRLLNP